MELEGRGGGQAIRLGEECGNGEVERACGVEAGGELNSSLKLQNVTVSREWAGEELWCRQSTGSFDVVCAGVNGPWRVDSHSTHEFESKRSRQCRAYWKRQGEHCNQLFSSCEEGVQNHMEQMESTQDAATAAHTSIIQRILLLNNYLQLILSATKYPLIWINEQ